MTIIFNRFFLKMKNKWQMNNKSFLLMKGTVLETKLPGKFIKYYWIIYISKNIEGKSRASPYRLPKNSNK